MSVVAILASIVTAQSVFSFQDGQQNVSITGRQGAARKMPNGNLRFELTGGPVVVRSKVQRVDMSALNVVAMYDGRDIKSLTANGSFRLLQTTDTGTTEFLADKGTYVAGAVQSTVTLTGKTTIRTVNATKRQILMATGPSGLAHLATKGKGTSGLIDATLAGPVRVSMTEQGPSTIIATANKMLLNNRPGSPTVTLTGNVTIQGQGKSKIGQWRNLSRAVIHLNARGEVTGFDTEAGE